MSIFITVRIPMRKKILLISAMAWLFTVNTAFANTNLAHETAVTAIQLTKDAGDYGRFSIPVSISQTTTVRMLPYQLEELESQFIIQVDDFWAKAQTSNTGFIQYLQLEDQKRVAIAQSGAAWADVRAKYMLWDRFYISFMQVWNNINADNYIPPKVIINPPLNNPILPAIRTFYEIKTYNTISGKSYTLRRSSDNLYWFNQSSRYGFNSQNQLINFLEQQNRIIYAAPNWRMYGIFKVDGGYRFNRDEWSISTLSWWSLNDVKTYINQHNQPIKSCQRAQERKCL
jgi:hypothetical protein